MNTSDSLFIGQGHIQCVGAEWGGKDHLCYHILSKSKHAKLLDDIAFMIQNDLFILADSKEEHAAQVQEKAWAPSTVLIVTKYTPQQLQMTSNLQLAVNH